MVISKIIFLILENKRYETNIKLIKRQEKLAHKNQKIFYKNTKKSNVTVGDYVRINVGKRDRYISNSTSVGVLHVSARDIKNVTDQNSVMPQSQVKVGEGNRHTTYSYTNAVRRDRYLSE